MPVVNRALLSCLPTRVEKKKLYMAPRNGFVMAMIRPKTREMIPENSIVARNDFQMMPSLILP